MTRCDRRTRKDAKVLVDGERKKSLKRSCGGANISAQPHAFEDGMWRLMAACMRVSALSGRHGSQGMLSPLNHVKASDVDVASKYSIALLSTRRRTVNRAQISIAESTPRLEITNATDRCHGRCSLAEAKSACGARPRDRPASGGPSPPRDLDRAPGGRCRGSR